MDTLALLNRWQRGFPLLAAPFARIAEIAGETEPAVLGAYRDAQRQGALSRIGGIWAAGAGGAALLCAMAVPTARLASVAAQVNALHGVNHNYEREHRFNLWFVITGRDASGLHTQLDALVQATGLATLRLPMQRAYRIDLGFDLHQVGRCRGAVASSVPVPRVAPVDAPLAALVEGGLPLVEAPFADWAQRLGWPEARVRQTLQRWLDHGTLRRFGVVVRHHELGIAHNAMTVFDVPDDQVDGCGAALARQPGVTLCYRRARAEGWPYNLYCMVHGRDRDAVRSGIAAARQAAGLHDVPHELLFSGRRFKQQGGSYFRHADREPVHALA